MEGYIHKACLYRETGYLPKTDLYKCMALFAGNLILMIGCGLFKNTVTDLQQSHEQTTSGTKVQSLAQRDWLSRSGSVSFYRDSSNLDYFIQIWPRGRFSFSAGEGFSGEADKIQVTGKAKAGSVSSERHSSLQQDKGKLQKEHISEKKSVADQKLKIKKSAVSWKWVIAGFAFMGVLSCFLYTKLKLIFKS